MYVLPWFYHSVFLLVSNQSQPKYSLTLLVLPLFMYIMYVIARLDISKSWVRNSPCFNTFIKYSFVIACFIYASFWLCIFLVVTAHKFDMISQADIISNSFAFVRPTLVLPPFCLLSLCLLSPKVFARNSPCFNPF